jgi:hypothetical protein
MASSKEPKKTIATKKNRMVSSIFRGVKIAEFASATARVYQRPARDRSKFAVRPVVGDGERK